VGRHHYAPLRGNGNRGYYGPIGEEEELKMIQPIVQRKGKGAEH